MHLSLPDIMRELTRQKERGRPEITLRGQVWLEHVKWSFDWSDGDAAKAIFYDRSDGALMRKWRRREVSPSLKTAESLDQTLEAYFAGRDKLLVKELSPLFAGRDRSLDNCDWLSRWVFVLPLWQLLRNGPIRQGEIEAIKRKFIVGKDCLPIWWFPGDDERGKAGHPVGCLGADSGGLVARNDIWGLIGALIQVRLHEAAGDAASHLESSKDAVRSIAGAARLPWVRPFARELIDLVDQIRRRVVTTSLLFDVDREVILRSADDPAYEPCRERRGRDPATYRFVEIDDPVLPAAITPGAEMQRRKLLKSRKQT